MYVVDYNDIFDRPWQFINHLKYHVEISMKHCNVDTE